MWKITRHADLEGLSLDTQRRKNLVVPLMHGFAENRLEPAKTLGGLVETRHHKHVAPGRGIRPSPIRISGHMHRIAARRPSERVGSGDEVKNRSAVTIDELLDRRSAHTIRRAMRRPPCLPVN